MANRRDALPLCGCSRAVAPSDLKARMLPNVPIKGRTGLIQQTNWMVSTALFIAKH